MTLVTLSRVKEFIPNYDTADDTVLTNILNAASDFVELYCNRKFTSATYDELYSGDGNGKSLLLDKYPVISVARLATNPTVVLRVQNTNANASRATVQVTATGLTLVSVASGVTTTNSLTFAANVTVQALATAIAGVSNWTATVQGPYATWASADLRALQGALPALKSAAGLLIHVDEVPNYTLNDQVGELYNPYWFSRGYQNYRVIYTAGYASLPEPVAQAVVEVAVATYQARGQNPNVQSETLGEYSYTNAVKKSFDTLSALSRTALNLYKSRRVPNWRVW